MNDKTKKSVSQSEFLSQDNLHWEQHKQRPTTAYSAKDMMSLWNESLRITEHALFDGDGNLYRVAMGR